MSNESMSNGCTKIAWTSSTNIKLIKDTAEAVHTI